MKITMEAISTFFVKRTFHLRFLLARGTKKSKLYKKFIDKLLFEDDEMYILPNDNSLKTSEKIEVNEVIEESEVSFLPSDVLKEVIKQSNHIVIMKNCLCRISNDCKDYPHDIGCIFIGKTTKKISRDFCYEASPQEAIEHVDKAISHGLTHLIGKNKIDSLWMNAKPAKDLLTICHCCPCCCLWKVLPELEESISDKCKRLPDLKVELNNDKCINCNKCLKGICFTNAISLENKKIKINQNLCRGCGRCVDICSSNAITLNYTDKSIDTVLNRIPQLIDLKNN